MPKPLVASTCIQYQIQPFGGHHVVFVAKKNNHRCDSHMVLTTKKKKFIAKIKKFTW
jgi:hypothetical protein